MRLAQVARLDERQPRYKCSVGEHVRNVRKVKALSQRVSPKDAVVDRLLLYSVNHEVAQASRGPSCHPLNRSLGRKLLELPLCMGLGVRLDDLRACDVMSRLCSLNPSGRAI